MATEKELLAVPLTRKYGSMPSLAQRSVISLEYKQEGFTPRRISGGSDPPKTGNKQSRAQVTLGLPLVRRSSETPAKNVRDSSFGREKDWRNPLLERWQTMGAGQESAGATKPNMEKTTLGHAGKRRLHEDVKFPESRHSEWLSRISAVNGRVNGTKTADASSKTRGQMKEQISYSKNGRERQGAQVGKTQIPRKTDIPKKTVLTTNKNTVKYSQGFSLEKEFFFQDYRQKCIQWLKSLPDSETQPMTLR